MYKKTKTESINEYLARGGKINRMPYMGQNIDEVLRENNAGPVNILSFEEADLFYGESKSTKPKRQKTTSRIDLSALPEALREKFLSKIRDEVEDVGDE